MYDRDQMMAREMVQIAEVNGYESVVVSCGGNHRSGIASYLCDEGWEVTEESTESLLGKILNFVSIKRVRRKWAER